MTKGIVDEKIFISSFCENDPQLETRLSSTKRHYKAIRRTQMTTLLSVMRTS